MTSSLHEHSQELEQPFAAYQKALRERLHTFLLTLDPVLRTDVIRALQEEGKLLSPEPFRMHTPPAGCWALLTWLVAEQIRPSIDTLLVSSIAVAVECVVCAIDLLDDIEDEDQTPVVREIGSARVVNTAAALLLLGQKCIIASAQFGLLPAQVLNLLDTLQDATLIVTTGQHRDILVEERQASEMTREECMDIAAQKAGALFVLACQMATLCAGADKELAKLFCELGSVLGIAHQLDNDSHDLYHLLQGKSSIVLPLGEEASTRSVKTDLSRRKKTLPIVLAARSGASLTEMVPVTGEDCDEEERQALHEAILTTWGISLLYRERARDFLQRIEIRRPVLPALRLLLGLT